LFLVAVARGYRTGATGILGAWLLADTGFGHSNFVVVAGDTS
jgi:hypothetical protein